MSSGHVCDGGRPHPLYARRREKHQAWHAVIFHFRPVAMPSRVVPPRQFSTACRKANRRESNAHAYDEGGWRQPCIAKALRKPAMAGSSRMLCRRSISMMRPKAGSRRFCGGRRHGGADGQISEILAACMHARSGNVAMAVSCANEMQRERSSSRGVA